MKLYHQAVQCWQNWDIRSMEDIDKYLDNFRILFAYHSGKIENPEITYHDTREIFENGKVTAYTGNPRTLFEQQNQKLLKYVLRDFSVCCLVPPRLTSKQSNPLGRNGFRFYSTQNRWPPSDCEFLSEI